MLNQTPKKHFALKLLMVLFLTAAVSGCSQSASSSKKQSNTSKNTITLMQTNELLSLDTSNHADLTTWNILDNTM